MKKQYPPAVMMRKRLILIAIIGLALLMALIIYNLCHGNADLTHAPSQKSATLPDMANSTDTAWFNNPERVKPTMVHEKSSLSHPLPIRSINTPIPMDADEHAAQAQISSNQIRAEPGEMEHSALKNISDSTSNDNTPRTDETNPQAEKKTFLKEAERQTPSYLPHAVENPHSSYEIKTGTIIPAILISGINSDLPGPITAQVRESIYDTIAGRHLLIPQGARLQGVYDSSIAYGQNRVLIAWQRLIFPNGQSLKLSGMPGTDVSGYAGFSDQVNNHYGRLFTSAVLMSAISAGLQLSQPQQSNQTNAQPSINQTLAQNVGINLSQTTDQLLRKNLNIQPTLEIRPGYLFNVSVTQDIIFPAPYSDYTPKFALK